MQRKTDVNSHKPRFPLGQTVMTRGVAERVSLAEIHAALRRHQCGDWGQVCTEDCNANEQAIKNGFRLLSAYSSQEGVKFWIITESDRSVTTVLLPDEY
jgi:hypothetical protein